jgi:hypothetical protein
VDPRDAPRSPGTAQSVEAARLARRRHLRSIRLSALAGLLAAMALLPPALVFAQANREEVASAIRVEASPLPSGRTGGFATGRIRNDSAYRIGGVRLRVDAADASGRSLEPVYGWVLGDIQARGQGVFRIALPAGAASFTASVIAYDLISVESP